MLAALLPQIDGLLPEDIDEMDAQEAKRLLRRGEFGAGSMKPKVEAALHFVEDGGERAVIGDLDDAVAALAGLVGVFAIFLIVQQFRNPGRR